MEESRMSDIFEQAYEAVGQFVGDRLTDQDDGHKITDDEQERTRPEEPLDEDFAEDIGYDEEYSDANNVLYTPTCSPIYDSDDLPDNQQTGTEARHSALSSSIPESAPKASPSDAHRSALPTYLMGLPQLTLSAAFAQGRRGSGPAHDDPSSENPMSHRTTEDQPTVGYSDYSSSSRRQSASDIPTVVDIVAELRATVRDEWDHVFRDDATENSNPYYSGDHWDKDALDNYTRFPHFRRHPVKD